MSSENTGNQNVTSRRGPDPRFVWGIVAVIVLGVVLCAGFMKFEDMSDKLTKAQTEQVQAQTELAQANQEIKDKIENIQQLESKKLELEQSTNEYNAKVEKLTEKISTLEKDISKLKSYPGARWIVSLNGFDLAFRWCPAGTFPMGSFPPVEADEKQHQVTLTKGFWMLETEVTQRLWLAVMGSDPKDLAFPEENRADPYSHYPVEGVSWDDCKKFCEKCSQMEPFRQLGLTVKLPTEAQWEYACYGGNDTLFYKPDMVEWDKTNSSSKTQRTLRKACNMWGLYDMHGNVWEMCEDWYGDYPSGPVTDPTGPQTGDKRVIRGGSFNESPENCRREKRETVPNSGVRRDVGFRIIAIPE